MKYFAADFETSVESDVNYHIQHGDRIHSKVYLWCLQELFSDDDKVQNIKIGNEITGVVNKKPIQIGYDIDSFIQTLANIKDNCTVYFHNLKFDGSFIRWWLNDNDYKFIDLYNVLKANHPHDVEFKLEFNQYIKDKNEFNLLKQPGTYEYLITNTGEWHYIIIHFAKYNVTFRDSLKLFNCTLDELLKGHSTFEKIGIKKTGLDVFKLRAPKYEVTDEEIVRCKNDTIGLAYVLGIHKLDRKSEGYLPNTTIGGCAINRYIDSLGTYRNKKKVKSIFKYRDIFPELNDIIDNFVRESYRGGWSYANPLQANKLLRNVEVYDMNSMYPSIMSQEKMPYGYPKFPRKYPRTDFSIDQIYRDTGLLEEESFFIIQFEAAFIVKPNGLPFITDHKQIISSAIYFDHDKLTLPEPLYSAFIENYNFVVTSPEINVLIFPARQGLFKDYIKHLYDKKQKYSKENNKVLKDVYKLLMNSLYGKFGQKRSRRHKIEDNGKMINTETPQRSEFVKDYSPLATAITGYSKLRLTRLARFFKDRFVYTDTDSIHVLKGDLGPLEEVYDKDNTGQLGLWKLEHSFKCAKYLHSKCYIGFENNKLITTIAGLKKQSNPLLNNGAPLTFDNFKVGAEINGNLKPVSVPGGVYLKPMPFEIRPQKPYSKKEKLLEVLKITGINDPYYSSDEFTLKYTYNG